MKINVLSLFDGISCGQVALNRLGIKVNEYFASEIHDKSIQITQKNFPNTIQLGDISNISYVNGILKTKTASYNVGKIHLVIGGSPCQSFSLGGIKRGFSDPRAKLFLEFVRLLNEVKPDYFLFENVKMEKHNSDKISKMLGVEYIQINSCLVSAQKRRRYYWTNIPNVSQPKDLNIDIHSIISKTTDSKFYYEDRAKRYILSRRRILLTSKRKKAPCLIASYHKAKDGMFLCVDNNGKVDLKTADYLRNKFKKSVGNYKRKSYYLTLLDKEDLSKIKIRRFTPEECEKLQTLPEGYTDGLSQTNRYVIIGNGWTVDVVAHILSGIKAKYAK